MNPYFSLSVLVIHLRMGGAMVLLILVLEWDWQKCVIRIHHRVNDVRWCDFIFLWDTPCPLLNDTKIFLYFFCLLRVKFIPKWWAKCLPGYYILELVFPNKYNKNFSIFIGKSIFQNGISSQKLCINSRYYQTLRSQRRRKNIFLYHLIMDTVYPIFITLAQLQLSVF